MCTIGQWSLSVGEIVALLTLVDKAYSPIAIFNVIYIDKKLEQVAYDRYREILQLPEDKALEKEDGRLVEAFDIDIAGVSYAYKEKEVLKDIFLNVKQGQKIAFVGESGSGKTTLVKLLLGLLKYEKGSIKVGNCELSDLNLTKFYKNIAYISQDVPIFDGSIRENIVFDKEIKNEEIMKVLKWVGLEKMVNNLENGLDSQIGEKGQLLSGGEKQRLAIARVFFEDAKLVILDEATSAMDNITEQQIMKNVLERLNNKTVIIIAHRLNTIKNVDKIYVMKDSHIIDKGKFEELLEKSEYFKKLWVSGKTKK